VLTRDIVFSSFYDFYSVVFWNCSDSVVVFEVFRQCGCFLYQIYESLDQKVYEFNKRVFDKVRDVEKVKISMNSNFTQNGRLRKHLYNDVIRLSRDGVCVLAANLKRILIGNNKQHTYSY
jgi:hypothetical protein